MTFSDALLYSVTGMLVVFFALVLLMVIIKIMIAVGDSRQKKAAPAPVEAPAPAAPAPAPVMAPGSAGELKLYDTDPRTAAMLMAIVADELQLPLNELRFLSIREVKESDPT